MNELEELPDILASMAIRATRAESERDRLQTLLARVLPYMLALPDLFEEELTKEVEAAIQPNREGNE